MIPSKYQLKKEKMKGWVEVVECPTITQARFWERRLRAAGRKVRVEKAAVNDGERGGPRRVFLVFTDEKGMELFDIPLGEMG